MSTTPCPHCGVTVRQSRADGRCVSCGKQLPDEMRAAGPDVVGTVARKPTPIDLPPVHQTFQFQVKCADFLARQSALWLAAARAVGTLPPVRFMGLELFLICNAATEGHDGWLRFSGHGDQVAFVFIEIVATRIRRWFRKPMFFRVALTAYLPPGSLNDVIGLVNDGSGLEELEKERDGRIAMEVFAAQVDRPVVSHAPGSYLVVR